MEQRKLRVAVLGCGRISTTYSSALLHLKALCEPVLAMDKELGRAERFAAQFPGCAASDEVGVPGAALLMVRGKLGAEAEDTDCDATAERYQALALAAQAGMSPEPEDLAPFRALLFQYRPDILHVLLPHYLHSSYVTAALAEGVHVLCEKPMDVSLAASDRMIAAAQTGTAQLGIILQNRYIDGVQRVRDLIASGALGEVKGAFSTLNWYRPPSYYECDWKGRFATEGGGVIIDQAIHSIDLVLYMTGLKAVRVQGHTARRVLKTIEVEDEADAAITLENGAIYSFFACNYYITNSPIRVEIHCEKGTALLTFDTMEIQWADGQKEIIHPTPDAAVASGESYWGMFHQRQIEACYRALLSGEKMPWDPRDARQTMEVALGIYLSARTQSEVTLG